MNNRKIVLPAMLFLSMQFYIIQSHELHPPQDTTELIELINKVFTEIVSTHEIYKYVTKESFYETCIHEMGHG